MLFHDLVKSSAATLAFALAFLAAGAAAAQETEEDGSPDMIPEDLEGVDEEKGPGWHPFLKASGNLSLAHNKNVVGNPDGTNLTLGYLINGELDHLSENMEHEWQNTLDWQLAYTRTPAFDIFLKNLDSLQFETAYLYHLPPVPWLGPFAAFKLKAQVFPGYDARTTDTTVTRLDPDGEREPVTDELGNPLPDRVYAAGKRIPLTDAFAPTTLRETVGLFAIPVDEKKLVLDIRAGFGAWETFVRDGYTIADDETTAALEIKRMEDFVQLGPELQIKADGLFNEIVSYGAHATFMYPAYTSVGTDLEGMDLLNSEFEFLLGVQLWEYASLDYSFKAYRLPLIADQWQIQNGLLLSITLQVV